MQIRSDARTAFLRWRSAGDLQALGQVFDLVGQELLLVASHVAGRGTQPEDLVQETFLTAIQRADRFDAERPLEPWLVGILVNVARNARRRGQRERTGVEMPLGAVEGDASEGAAANELAQELHAAIALLPVPQREVMTLYLVHGMTPTEIAHASARPVGTVKSWIARSLDEVRRRLPAGYAAALGSLLRGMQRMEAVRAHVLDAAVRSVAAGTAANAATPALGAARLGVRASRWWLPLGALAALAVVASSALWPHPVAPGTPATLAGTVPGDEPTLPRTAAAPARDAATTDPSIAAAAATPTCRLTIVGDPIGAPFAFHGSLIDPMLTDPALLSREFVSDSEGVAVLADVAYGEYLLLTDRGDSVSVDVLGSEQTCTVALPGGRDARGRVVDDRGAGIAAATVWMSLDGKLDEGVPVAITDASGTFAARALPPGRHLQARAPGWRSSTLQRFAPADASDTADAVLLEFQLVERGTTVVCEVVDADGRPVPHARVQLGGCLPRAAGHAVQKLRDLRAPWVGHTDAHGLATCDGAPITDELLVFARAPGLPGIERRLVTTTLPTTVRLTLPRPASVSGTMRTANGAPHRAQANALGDGITPAVTTPVWLLPRCIADEHGRYRLTGVPTGTVRVRAVADEGVAERTFVLRAGDDVVWDPEPRRDGTIDGKVTAADGGSLAGCRVRAAMVGAAAVVAEVGADGTFALRGLADAEFELLVLPPAPAEFVLQRRHPTRPGERVDLGVPIANLPRATVRGRVGDELRALVLTGPTGDTSLLVPGGGAFTFGGLPAGRYRLLAGPGSRNRLSRVLDVAAGAELDLGMLVPDESVRFQVRCDELRDVVLDAVLHTDDCMVMPTFARMRDGTAELEVMPGTYWLALYRGGNVLATQRLAVGPDTTTVAIPPARGLAVQLLAAPAVPTTSLRVLWEIEGPDGLQRHTTVRPAGYAAHGSTALNLKLAAGTHTIRAKRPDGATVTVSLTLPLAPGAAPPLLRLP